MRVLEIAYILQGGMYAPPEKAKHLARRRWRGGMRQSFARLKITKLTQGLPKNSGILFRTKGFSIEMGARYPKQESVSQVPCIMLAPGH